MENSQITKAVLLIQNKQLILNKLTVDVNGKPLFDGQPIQGFSGNYNDLINKPIEINVVSPIDKQGLIYNQATSKWVNETISVSDEKVKMTIADTTGKYLNDLLDHSTIENVGGVLVAKTLDGLTVSISEINTLQGMTGNVKTILDSLASAGMTYTGIVSTKADLNAVTGMVTGNVKIVTTDETQSGKRMAYIYSGTTWENVGEANIQVRNFSTSPIDLASEVTGILPITNVNTSTLATQSDLANYTNTTDLQSNYALKSDLTGKINSSDIVDNLTSTDTTKPLSANQGSVIKGLIDGKTKVNDSAISSFTDTYSIDKLNSTYAKNTDLSNKLESSDIVAGLNITLTKSGNSITINSTATGGGVGISTWNTFNF